MLMSSSLPVYDTHVLYLCNVYYRNVNVLRKFVSKVIKSLAKLVLYIFKDRLATPEVGNQDTSRMLLRFFLYNYQCFGSTL